MDSKRLIHAVAGSGKTRTIVEFLNPEKRNLIITYTENNQNVLKNRIIQKFGSIPEHTYVYGVFEFLYSFCLVPYLGKRPKGINFDYIPKNGKYSESISSDGRVIHYQLSHILLSKEMTYNYKKNPIEVDYLVRIEKFFDYVYIDECQDFESYDFDWMLSLSKLNINVTLLGDFYQKTYSTSNAGNKGKAIHSDFNKWTAAIRNIGFKIDNQMLSFSYRCPSIICDFVSEKLKISISSKSVNSTASIELIEDREKIYKIMEDDSIIKLFYCKSLNYACYGQNWGASKGEEYKDVCIILNKRTYELFKKDQLDRLATTTKAKFYVACTRAMDNLYFISEDKVKYLKKV